MLLFLVQPMIGKMVLPSLGGTPAVWNTCMVFFQGVLLIGYGYTHTVSGWRSRRRQLLAQFAILALPFLVLPFSLGNWEPPADRDPAQSVLWLLLGMVGLPFFVVATSAPLLQRWFAATGHPAGKDPYFLYGASNLGSLLALGIYPILVEPNFSLPSQTWLWTAGYGVLVLMVAGCGYFVWQTERPLATQILPASAEAPPAPQLEAVGFTAGRGLGRPRSLTEALPAAPPTAASSGEAITLGRRLRWIGLAAAPTSLMLGVTTYLTTDISAIPLFWIIPLGLYLLTFILVFARWPIPWIGMPHTILLYVQPCILMLLVLFMLIAGEHISMWFLFVLHLAAFFTTALVCHGELAKDRPAAHRLTDFYLCMSLGGVLGGMFNALLAPQFFWFGVAEYYLAMVLACCLRPRMLHAVPMIPGDTNQEQVTQLGRVLDGVIPLGLGALGFLLARYGENIGYRSYFFAVGAVLVLALAGRPVRFGLSLGTLVLGVLVYEHAHAPFIFEGRSFYGFVKVRSEMPDELEGRPGLLYHQLVHGGINHGAEIIEPKSMRRDTITYFHPTSGIGQVFKRFSWPDARLPASLVGLGASPWSVLVAMQSEPPYAVVGLGTGILAAHAKPWEHVVFYEIDPMVRDLSLTPSTEPYFYYLHDAIERGAKLEVVLGDGRLTLKDDPFGRKLDRYFHIIVLDAFSSDAIPIHLLTAEAVDLYLSKLTPDGLLIFNTTNRYINLPPVLARIAERKNMDCYHFGDYEKDEHGNVVPDKFGSDWVVLQKKSFARTGQPFGERMNMKGWKKIPSDNGPMWTDDYSNLLNAIHW